MYDEIIGNLQKIIFLDIFGKLEKKHLYIDYRFYYLNIYVL